MSTLGLSFVGRFVLFRSVFYQRFHNHIGHSELLTKDKPKVRFQASFHDPGN